jgi:peroxiredoxin
MKRAIGCLIVIFVITLGVIADDTVSQQAVRADSTEIGVRENMKAPDFSLTDLTGKKVNLKDYRGKTVLINFFATWCPYCRQEIPELVELHKKYVKKGLVILTIDIQESKDKVKRYMDKEKVQHKVLLDLNASVAQMYEVAGIPTNLIIDKKGIVKYYGNLPPKEDQIVKLLK